MTKKEMINRKKALAYQIRNIKDDFRHLAPEDVPEEITEEIYTLMAELKELRDALGQE